MMAISDKHIDGGSCRHIVEIRLTNPNTRCVDTYQTTPIINNKNTDPYLFSLFSNFLHTL